MIEGSEEAVEWTPVLDDARKAAADAVRDRLVEGAGVFRNVRRILGLTQIEAAARMSITQAGYSKAERRALADVEQLRRLVEGSGYEVVIALRKGDELVEIRP